MVTDLSTWEYKYNGISKSLPSSLYVREENIFPHLLKRVRGISSRKFVKIHFAEYVTVFMYICTLLLQKPRMPLAQTRVVSPDNP